MDLIVRFGGTPILFQTSQLHGKSAKEKAEIYLETCRGCPGVLAFDLGQMFAPNGEIFDAETFLRLMEIPEIKGIKHSSLDRLVELERLALRDVHRPDFHIYTGNDLGINMIEDLTTYSDWRPWLLKNSRSVTFSGKEPISGISLSRIRCSIWVTWHFANLSPHISIQPRFSCT